MGYFHALKLAFLTSLIRKYMLWEGFYHDFSTKKRVSWSGGEAHQGAPPPGPPPGGAAPWTPEVTSPPLTIYPGAAPVGAYRLYLSGEGLEYQLVSFSTPLKKSYILIKVRLIPKNIMPPPAPIVCTWKGTEIVHLWWFPKIHILQEKKACPLLALRLPEIMYFCKFRPKGPEIMHS